MYLHLYLTLQGLQTWRYVCLISVMAQKGNKDKGIDKTIVLTRMCEWWKKARRAECQSVRCSSSRREYSREGTRSLIVVAAGVQFAHSRILCTMLVRWVIASVRLLGHSNVKCTKETYDKSRLDWKEYPALVILLWSMLKLERTLRCHRRYILDTAFTGTWSLAHTKRSGAKRAVDDDDAKARYKILYLLAVRPIYTGQKSHFHLQRNPCSKCF